MPSRLRARRSGLRAALRRRSGGDSRACHATADRFLGLRSRSSRGLGGGHSVALGCLSVAVLALSLSGCGRPAPDDSRPNVLLITIDTLRADRLGSYGYEFPTSPRIDQLAASGLVFERAIAAASTTAPAHASIMTSRYTREHSIGYNNGGTKLIDETLATRFRAAGYATGAFVGNLMLQPRTGFDQGFDVFDGELPESEANRELVFERVASQTSELALEWLRRQRGGPFFLWVHYQDPHGPYTPPEGFRGRIHVLPKPDEKALPVTASENGWGGIPSYQALDGLDLPSAYESLYADEILYADHWVGRLLDAVDDHRSGREAIVLLTADHGESFGEMDRWFSHGFSTLPSLAHVPFILRAPGLSPGRRDETVHHVDIAPTLLDLAGLPVLEEASGISLVPALRDQGEVPDRFVFCDIGTEVTAYRGNTLVRASSLDDAWRPDSEGALGPSALWLQYLWRADGSWLQVAEDSALQGATRAYLEKAAPMKNTPLLELDELEKQRLRALGYSVTP